MENIQPAAFAADNEVYKMLFGSNYATLEAEGATGTKAASKYTGEMPYWLAYACEGGDTGGAYFGVFFAISGVVNGFDCCLWSSIDEEMEYSWGVRPVVSLESGITLTSAGAGSWTLPE